MASRGQTHQKREREFARRERRERKQAKKAAQRAGDAPVTADDNGGDLPVDRDPETVPGSIQ